MTSTPLLLLDTRNRTGAQSDLCEEANDPSGSGSLVNEGEAEIVVHHVLALLQAGLRPFEIAVQSPYQAQVQFIKARLEESSDMGPFSNSQETPQGSRPGLASAAMVEVATVDSFQGREAEAVIISMVSCVGM